jgi:ATP-binding cassette, subfamily B, bacterial
MDVEGSDWRFIASLVRPHRRLFIGYGLLLALATSLPIGASLLMAKFVDLAVDGAGSRTLLPYGLGYAAIGLAASGLGILVTWRATQLAWKLTNGLRNDLASHVLNADLAFHRDRTPGELLTRCDSDVTSLTTFLSSVVSRIFGIILLIVEPILAPALVVGYAALGWTGWRVRNTSTEATVAERTIDAEMSGMVEQYLAGADDVASLAGGNHGLRRFADAAALLVKAAGCRVKAEMQVQASIKSTIAACQVGILVVGALAFASGRVGIGGVVLGYRLVVVVREPVEHLTWRLNETQGVAGAARRVFELLAEQRRVVSGDGLLPSGPLDLRFQQVGLVYDDASEGETALQDFNLTIAAGRVVGLVGRSGSGKTTIARLLLRLVTPTSGIVAVGGTSVVGLDDTEFRRRVGAIPQDVQLFPGTVRDNVSMFSERSDADVEQALRDAGLSRWYDELPNGLDTMLSSDGRNDDSDRTGLSAGEAQLLAIARALLRRPDVVVLDEATSRVDPATQEAISMALGRLVSGRTGVIIAHRLETLDVCDDIAVLANGALVEFGPRLVLAADPTSRYAALRAIGDDAEELR